RISAADGTRSIRATTFRALVGCSLPAAATPPMSQSVTRSVLVRWSASKFSRTRSRSRTEQKFSLAKRARQALGPPRLAGLVSQQILAYFDLDMRNRALLPVDRNSVVALVTGRVGLVVAHDRPALGAKQREQFVSEPCVPVVQDADLPRPVFAVEHRGEAVHRDEDRLPPGDLAGVEFDADTVVVWLENLAPAQIGFCRADLLVAGYRSGLAQRRD